jgi:hypothetical protein
MRRRTFLGMAAALGAATVTGACGVPSSSDPIRLGNAPTPGPPDNNPRPLPGADDAKLPGDLVEYFLSAPAGANTIGGDRPDAVKQAQDRMRGFFTDNGQSQWQPGSRVLVVRASLGPPASTDSGESTIDVAWVPLGYLDDFGDLAPVQNSTFHAVFTVVSVGSVGNNQWRIDSIERSTGAPTDLLLMDTALARWYDVFPAYFWDQDADILVPELRYMPAAITNAKRPAEIVRWLRQGPSSWLSGVLKPVPQEIEVKEPEFDADAFHLTLNLSSKAANLAEVQRKFAIQVWWMLRQGTVEITVEGASTGIKIDGTAAMTFNPAARVDDGTEVERFCIVDGKVRETDGQLPPLLSPVGNPNPNTDVLLAAMTRTKQNGALVRKDDKQWRLWIGTVSGSGESQTGAYVPTAVAGKVFSRPVWIGRPRRSVMIVVDNTLMTVSPKTPNQAGLTGVAVTLPRGLPTPVSAVSVAPDGRRIALVAGDQVIVAPMSFSDDGAVTIQDTFRTVDTPLNSRHAVAWGSVWSLLVGGAPGPADPTSLLMVPLSSAVQQALPVKTFTVDQISSRPINDNNPNGRNNLIPLIMIESNGQALNLFQDQLSNIQPPPGSAPSPSASAGTNQPRPVVSSPFFLDLD